jgi:hypothetical protein
LSGQLAHEDGSHRPTTRHRTMHRDAATFPKPDAKKEARGWCHNPLLKIVNDLSRAALKFVSRIVGTNNIGSTTGRDVPLALPILRRLLL